MNEETTTKSDLTTVDLFSTEQALEQKAKEHEQNDPISLDAARIYENLRADHPKINEDRLRKLARETAESHQQALEFKKKMDQGMQGASLEEILHSKAEIFKLENARVDGRATKVVLPKIESRDVADMLKEATEWRVIVIGLPKGGEQSLPSDAFDTAPVYYYNPKTNLYDKSRKSIEKLMLCVENTLTERARNDVYEWIRVESDTLAYVTNPRFIPFRNGVYDMQQHKLTPFSPKHPFLYKLPFDYNPKATQEPEFGSKHWKLSKWINALSMSDGYFDENKNKLIWQILACALHLHSPAGDLAFWLIDNGHGRSGKGTFQALITNLAGVNNVGSLKIAEFGHRFRTAALLKPVVIGDDNPPTYISDNSNFRSAVTHDQVFVETKGKQGYDIYPRSLIIQSMNNFPKFKDTTFANLRRQRVIKFNHEFKEGEFDPNIKGKYMQDPKLLEWLALKIITEEEAGNLDIDNIVNTSESEELLEGMQRDNDPVFNFASELLTGDIKSTVFSTDLMYNIFLAWNEDSEHVSINMRPRRFKNELKQSVEKLGWKFMAKNIPSDMLPAVKMNPTDFDSFTPRARDIYSKSSKKIWSDRNKSIIYKP